MMRDKIKDEMTALAPLGLAETDYATKGYHLDIQVNPEQVVVAAEIMNRAGFFLEAITGVDWLPEAKAATPKPKAPSETGEQVSGEEAAVSEEQVSEPEMEVVYDYNLTSDLCRVVVRTRIVRANPELPSISQLYPGANWHERETHDFFGIRFIGHPELKPLLLPEDADFHPLLKG
jgi:NADH-quinone oxidoreductase subunit C